MRKGVWVAACDRMRGVGVAKSVCMDVICVPYPALPLLHTVTEGDETVIGYLKYCREQGMNYKAEITDMLQGGLYTYKDKVQAVMQVG